VVGNDRIKSSPDLVAAKPPGGGVTAGVENDAAKLAPKSNAMATVNGKGTPLIERTI